MSADPEKVAVVVIWHGGQLLVEERPDEPKYAFPGGKFEDGEEAVDAALREAKEETNLDFVASDLRGPEIIPDNGDGFEGHVFETRVPFGAAQAFGKTILCNFPDLLEFKKQGKLMRISEEYMEKHF